MDAVGDGEIAVAGPLELRAGRRPDGPQPAAQPGLEATRRIVAPPRTAVLVLTMVDDDETVAGRACGSGPAVTCSRSAVQDEVLAAIRTVAAGGAVFGPGVAERLLAGVAGPRPHRARG